MRIRAWAVVAGLALAATMTTALPAAASVAPAAKPAAVQSTDYHFTAVPANHRASCYGYYGTFRGGTFILVVNWVHSSDECFGISTDRTIWHAWPGSGGWKKMAGNGLADDVAYPINEGANGSKGVVVWVDGNRYLVQRYALPLGWTGEWTAA